LYPGLSETIKIVKKQMRHESQVRAGDEEEVGMTGIDDAEELSDEEARFFLS